jgi:hypothetical protein
MYQRDYKCDRQWADSYEDQVLRILTELMPHLVMLYVASDEKDMKQATDFEVRMKGGAIAVRLRRTKKCRWRDLTIRTHRDTGSKTELAKIKEGYAFRYFYGWIDENGIIVEWMLVDLNKVRSSKLLDKKRQEIPNKDENGNLDGTYFIAIPKDELREAGCLIVEFPPLQRNVNIQVSQEDIDEGIERAKHRKYHKPKIVQQGPELWDEESKGVS